MVFTTNGLAENVGILGTNSHDDTATHNQACQITLKHHCTPYD